MTRYSRPYRSRFSSSSSSVGGDDERSRRSKAKNQTLENNVCKPKSRQRFGSPLKNNGLKPPKPFDGFFPERERRHARRLAVNRQRQEAERLAQEELEDRFEQWCLDNAREDLLDDETGGTFDRWVKQYE